MALFDRNNRRGGFMDEIRCDEADYLIWKWRPAGTQPGESGRENAVRWGSSLRVRDGEAAVFVYFQPDGTVQDFIEGPADLILETNNLPVLSGVMGALYGGGTPFPAEVYFINLARIVQVKFGVPFFDVYDPRFPDFGVPVAVRGTISFRISDYRAFIKLHRLGEFRLEDFQKQIRDAVSRHVKNVVANISGETNTPVIQLESKISLVNDRVEAVLSPRLSEAFGVSVRAVDIAAIEIDRSSEGYKQLMAVSRDLTAVRARAEAEDYAERLRISREEEQYERRKKTQSEYLSAFQEENRGRRSD